MAHIYVSRWGPGQRRMALPAGCRFFVGALIVFWMTALIFFPLPSPAWGSEAGEIFLARGTKFYLDGNYRQAKEELSQAAGVDSGNAEIWFMLGSVSFALKEYSAALTELTKAQTLAPGIPGGKLYLGATNYYLGNYPAAARWLQEAKAENPQDGLVRYYLGLVAYQRNHPQEALSELETGLRLAPQFALGFKPYQEILAARPEAKRNYDVTFATGLGYDDNVKVLPNQSNINPAGVRQYKGHKADMYVPLLLRGEYRPLVRENAVLGLRYYTYATLNFYLDMFNIWDQLGEVYLKYRYGPFIFEPYYAFDYTLLGAERYSQFQNAGLRLSIIEAPFLVGDLVYLFQSRDFRYSIKDPNYYRDGYINQVGMFQTLSLTSRGALRVGMLYERELSQGVNWTSNKYRFPVEVIFPLPWRLSFYGYFEYARTNASNMDTVAGVFRHDDYFEVDAQLRRPLTSYLDAIATYSHIGQLSNIPDFAYNRNFYQMMLSLKY
jgi:tetratricopeptide (TPR) repeat protein